jgi:uncharacterized protein YjeT (DUF2065 family)
VVSLLWVWKGLSRFGLGALVLYVEGMSYGEYPGHALGWERLANQLQQHNSLVRQAHGIWKSSGLEWNPR